MKKSYWRLVVELHAFASALQYIGVVVLATVFVVLRERCLLQYEAGSALGPVCAIWKRKGKKTSEI
jgi:hypothetical protein